MATKAKDSTTSGKELKKSTSALNTHTNHTKKPTKSSSTTTSDKTTSSTSTTKQIPNYLKPTLSASLHHENSSGSLSAGAKKHGSEDPAASHKPTLNRRRSFDKPPSPSRLQKALVSPGRDTSLRSSSFSAKGSNVLKSSIERSTSKTSRAGKPQLLYAKSVKKSSTSGSVKKESSAASTRAPKSQDITQTLNLEANLEAIQSLDHHEVEEVDKIDSEEHDKVVLPDPKVEENEHVSDHDAAVEAEENSGEDQKLKPSDNSTVSNAEELKENVDDRNEESGNTLTQEEKPADNVQHEVEENQKKLDESSEAQPEEGLASEDQETKVEVKEDIERESEKEEVAGDAIKNVEDKASEEKEGEEVVSGEIEEAKAAEAAEAAEVSEAAEATEAADETAKTRQASGGAQGGKKDSAPAYNDVIEETASKLLEKRKNKVKALVGAFETVIDYESGSK